MRAVIQRAFGASVSVDGEIIGSFDGSGLVILLGVTHSDSTDTATALAQKIAHLRIMTGERSVLDSGGQALVVSQFTLYADTKKGRRPSWGDAAPGPVAQPLYEHFCEELAAVGVRVSRGAFGADMRVTLTNDGPVTLIVEA